jgi:phosphoglycolate phosphatase-like HAD superfamily hydrolase
VPEPDVGPAAKRLVWLFDIDGTLLLTDGASREAFSHALKVVLGIEDDLAQVPFLGRTEPVIVADILSRHDAGLSPADEPRFWNVLFDHMRRILVHPRGHLMPGVPAILDAAARGGEATVALLTGNMTEMARIKLARFGLETRFAFWACGEEAEDRNALAHLAVARARERYGVPAARCVVIGDTEHDIECARAAGAWAVAVATGGTPREVLARNAPDLLLENLADPRDLLEWADATVAGTGSPSGPPNALTE